MSDDIERRFQAITHKLWGDEMGEEIYQWIVTSRPPAFHAKLREVMVPIWEMDRVDLRTKILCSIAMFTATHKQEVEFFMKMAAHHEIPREEVEEILLLAGLEFGFPAAEMAIDILTRVYSEHEARSTAG
ncbi:MAG: hypothetical protein OXG59_06085 [Gammaproteobacteria bacterium]|nr:hypothetical protein [Gammaproteobacteria bacterium]